MANRLAQPDNVNILIGRTDWAWPQAVAQIFQPRGINALVADSAAEVVRIISNNKIHLALLDMSFGDLNGVQTLKMIRQHDRLLPCILLAQQIGNHLLADALALNAFCVLAKPVDLRLLADQVHRLFTKYYASNLFTREITVRVQQPKNMTTVLHWNINPLDERSTH